MGRVQENGRFAVNIISEAIRSSGNYGCIPWYSPEIGNIQRQVSDDEINGFDAVLPKTTEGAEGGGIGGLDASDSLELLRLIGDTAPIDTIAYAPNVVITTEWALEDVEQNDLLFVSNCLVGDFIKAGNIAAATPLNIPDATGNLRTGLYDRLDQQNTVSKVERVRFEVDADQNLVVVTNDNLDTGATDINGSSDALIGGIENIQFRYGVDTDDNFVPNYIDDYDNIPLADRANIIAIEVNVLVGSLGTDSSVANVVSEPQSFLFAGQNFVAPDRALYRPFQTLVTIRNRVK
jgi:type IV pilus assembly protein PilW